MSQQGGKCKRRAFGGKDFCAAHACPKDGCTASKRSSEKFCDDPSHVLKKGRINRFVTMRVRPKGKSSQAAAGASGPGVGRAEAKRAKALAKAKQKREKRKREPPVRPAPAIYGIPVTFNTTGTRRNSRLISMSTDAEDLYQEVVPDGAVMSDCAALEADEGDDAALTRIQARIEESALTENSDFAADEVTSVLNTKLAEDALFEACLASSLLDDLDVIDDSDDGGVWDGDDGADADGGDGGLGVSVDTPALSPTLSRVVTVRVKNPPSSEQQRFHQQPNAVGATRHGAVDAATDITAGMPREIELSLGDLHGMIVPEDTFEGFDAVAGATPAMVDDQEVTFDEIFDGFGIVADEPAPSQRPSKRLERDESFGFDDFDPIVCNL